MEADVYSKVILSSGEISEELKTMRTKWERSRSKYDEVIDILGREVSRLGTKTSIGKSSLISTKIIN